MIGSEDCARTISRERKGGVLMLHEEDVERCSTNDARFHGTSPSSSSGKMIVRRNGGLTSSSGQETANFSQGSSQGSYGSGSGGSQESFDGADLKEFDEKSCQPKGPQKEERAPDASTLFALFSAHEQSKKSAVPKRRGGKRTERDRYTTRVLPCCVFYVFLRSDYRQRPTKW